MKLTISKIRVAEVSAPLPGNSGPPTSPFATLPCFPR